jgi:hypothetical protein
MTKETPGTRLWRARIRKSQRGGTQSENHQERTELKVGWVAGESLVQNLYQS